VGAIGYRDVRASLYRTIRLQLDSRNRELSYKPYQQIGQANYCGERVIPVYCGWSSGTSCSSTGLSRVAAFSSSCDCSLRFLRHRSTKKPATSSAITITTIGTTILTTLEDPFLGAAASASVGDAVVPVGAIASALVVVAIAGYVSATYPSSACTQYPLATDHCEKQYLDPPHVIALDFSSAITTSEQALVVSQQVTRSVGNAEFVQATEAREAAHCSAALRVSDIFGSFAQVKSRSWDPLTYVPRPLCGNARNAEKPPDCGRCCKRTDDALHDDLMLLGEAG
jgi:hypothetical protein